MRILRQGSAPVVGRGLLDQYKLVMIMIIIGKLTKSDQSLVLITKSDQFDKVGSISIMRSNQLVPF